MKKTTVSTLLLGCLLHGLAQTPAAGGDSARFFLHKFAQNIGQEVYYRTAGDSGVSYAVRFKFVDRGSPVPLIARILLTPSGEPLRFWIKGNTSRFSTVHDSVSVTGSKAYAKVDDSSFTQEIKGPAFPVAGYSPATVQMLLLQYWNKHGRPEKLRLLPTGSVSIKMSGYDTLFYYGNRLPLQRLVISGLVWGNELVWTDNDGNLVCLITNDAEGDKLEMMLDKYESLLPELIGRAATYGMQLFAASMKGDDGGSAGARGQKGVLAIVGGRMVDVAMGATTPDAVILIENGKIIKAGPKAAVAVPAGAKIIHAEGRTILPGLWDMHAHFEQAEWGPAYLAAGVTTVRDCGNEFNYINSVKRAIDEGVGVGPHILKAGIIDGPGPMGLGIVRAGTPQEAKYAVRRYKDSGFVQIKIYSSVTAPILKVICDEAHRLGLTVTGHIPEGMNLEQGVDSGMDMVNHIQYVGPILARTKDRLVDWNDPKTAKGLDFIRQHGTVIDPTLGVFEMIFRSVKDSITSMEPAFGTLPQPLQVLFVTMGMPPAQAEKFKSYFKDLEKQVKVLHDMGVPIVAGTDMGFPGYSVDRELELYVDAGLTPLEALRTATIVPALVMKQAGISGSLMPGRDADIILVDGDPLHHIRDIRKVKLVIKDGKVYDPLQLHKIAGFSK
ncbi:amidohydrolase family protein [Puia sp.]|jgi:imidazolonepropionase-like amidohydrolase|uniref:amidohydrolase family protein n=1 Tax=Puia sp. TaxID=2045100 RepID=UPI002F40658D